MLYIRLYPTPTPPRTRPARRSPGSIRPAVHRSTRLSMAAFMHRAPIGFPQAAVTLVTPRASRQRRCPRAAGFRFSATRTRVANLGRHTPACYVQYVYHPSMPPGLFTRCAFGARAARTESAHARARHAHRARHITLYLVAAHNSLSSRQQCTLEKSLTEGRIWQSGAPCALPLPRAAQLGPQRWRRANICCKVKWRRSRFGCGRGRNGHAQS
jgi:hypothetical protein